QREGQHRRCRLGAGDVDLLEGAGQVRRGRVDPGGARGTGEQCGGGRAGEDGGAPAGSWAPGGGLGRAHAGRSVSAEAAARRAAAAFDWVSRCSMVASESATTPPPACTWAVPSLMTAVRIAIAMSMPAAKANYPTVPPSPPRRAGTSHAVIRVVEAMGG